MPTTFSRDEVRALYDQPLLTLLDEARRLHCALAIRDGEEASNDVEAKIAWMGPSAADRCDVLRALANRSPQPPSVSIAASVESAAEPLDVVRMIAVARILMPHATLRLSAGRRSLTREAQLLCMLAGATAITYAKRDAVTRSRERARTPQKRLAT